MFAVIDTGGKQYRVSEGNTIKIEKLPGNDGDTIEFDNILAVGENEDINLGFPLIDKALVVGKILHSGRDKKIVIFKHKRRKNYRKKTGHRQSHIKVKIEKINIQ